MYIKQKSKAGNRRLRKTTMVVPTPDLPEYGLGGDVFAAAASGAATGALAGAPVGGVGAPIGAVIGGVVAGGTALVKGLKDKKANEASELAMRTANIKQQKLANMEEIPQYESVYSAAEGTYVNPTSTPSGIPSNAPLMATLTPKPSTAAPTSNYIGNRRDELARAKNKGVGSPILYDEKHKAVYQYDPKKSKTVQAGYRVSPQNFRDFQLDRNTRGMIKSDFIRNYRKYKAGEMSEKVIPNFEILMRRNPAWIPEDTKGVKKTTIVNPEKETVKSITNTPGFVKTKTSTYAEGGMVDPRGFAKPNVEIEGGESIEGPGGQRVGVEGRSHAAGGIPVHLLGGTKVYSNQLRVPGTNSTFADVHKSLTKKIEKNKKSLSNPENTRLAERTAKRNLVNLKKKEEKLFAIQQELNGEAEKQRQQQAQQMQQMQAQQGAPGQMMPPQGMGGLNGPQMASQGPSAQPGMQPQMGGLPMGKYGMELPKYGGGNITPGEDDLDYATQAAQNAIQRAQLLAKNQQSLLGPSMSFGQQPGGYGEGLSIRQKMAAGLPLKSVSSDPIVPYENYSPKIKGLLNTLTGNRNLSQSEYDYLEKALAEGIRDPEQLKLGMQQARGGADLTGQATYKLPGKSTPPPSPVLNNEFEGEAENNADDLQWALNSAERELVKPGGFDAQFTGKPPVKEQVPGNKTASTIGAIATLAPMLYNLGEGIFGKRDKIDPNQYQNNAGMIAAARMQNRKYNINPILRSNRAAYNSGVRNLAARSRGEQLSNMGALSTGLANANAQAYANKNNVENQYGMAGDQLAANVGGFNAQTAFNTKRYNDEVDNSAHRLTGAGLAGISNLVQQRDRDKRMYTAMGLGYNSMLGMFGDVAPNAVGAWTQKNQMAPGEEFNVENLFTGK